MNEFASESMSEQSSTDYEINDENIKNYLLGEMTDDDMRRFEAVIEDNPDASNRLDQAQEQFQQDWYDQKFTVEEEEKFWYIYVLNRGYRQKHTNSVKQFLVAVSGAGDRRIMPRFLHMK